MKVWKTSVYSDFAGVVIKKFVAPEITSIFVIGILNYFQEKTYGEAVNEIYYRQFCFDANTEQPIEPFYLYGKRKKIIDCIVNLEYDIAVTLEVPALARYMAEKYLERTKDFGKLGIKNFAHEEYLTDLKNFFRISGVL